MKTKLLPLAAIISMAAFAPAHAENIPSEGTSAYVVDSDGNVVRDNFGGCVRSIDWTKETAIAKCEGWEEPKPVAEPEPAPVVAPAPEPKPAPVAAPAPVAPPKFVAHFDNDKYNLKTDDVPELDAFAKYMNRECSCKIAITGHTDSAGTKAYNQRLSEERAQEVADYLGNKGVAPSRMVVTGQGETAPIATNSTKEGRAQNRRVEVEIVE
ncbi:OmpA family protein [Thiomicrorhabdus sp. ZW0627]|uniref:OmpA family protein n=1 Tax=Thiomicrorhabdus sp. ZW0627 TaxID=3039774 RepID=UPI002436B1E9|nr:OmpA family protein [Thiomicrorhabdus sp. ZW0627]MDG6773861.1 OmpA family protein [Thiomicrorhabdus sp. ZW0627]